MSISTNDDSLPGPLKFTYGAPITFVCSLLTDTSGRLPCGIYARLRQNKEAKMAAERRLLSVLMMLLLIPPSLAPFEVVAADQPRLIEWPGRHGATILNAVAKAAL